MKNWKVRIYDCKTFETMTEMVIPDILAQMIFENKNLTCAKDYPSNKIYSSKTHTAVFDEVIDGLN